MKSLLKKLKPLEIKLKKTLVVVISYFLKRSLRKIEKPDFTRPLKLLFVRHERIGDTFISFPIIDILKRKYPTWEFYWVTSPRSYDLVSEDPRFSQVFLYTKKPVKDRKILHHARKVKFDIAVDLINGDSVSAMMLTHLLAPRAFKISMGKCDHAKFYHINMEHPYSFSNRHILESTLELVEHFGVDPSDAERFCPPFISETKKKNIAEFLNSVHQSVNGCPLIGVNICSGETTRLWGSDNFREMITQLMDKYPDPRFIIIADPGSYDAGIELAESFSSRVYIPPKPMDICSVAELISRLSLLITADTSLLHFARSYRIPIVGLYLARKIDIWFPYAQRSGIVESDSEKSVSSITVDQIVEKVHVIGDEFKIPGLVTCPTRN